MQGCQEKELVVSNTTPPPFSYITELLCPLLFYTQEDVFPWHLWHFFCLPVFISSLYSNLPTLPFSSVVPGSFMWKFWMKVAALLSSHPSLILSGWLAGSLLGPSFSSLLACQVNDPVLGKCVIIYIERLEKEMCQATKQWRRSNMKHDEMGE